MSITIPDEFVEAAGLSEAEVLKEVALALFAREAITAGQACRLAGVDPYSGVHGYSACTAIQPAQFSVTHASNLS